MFNLDEIEELFKTEELSKNKAMIHALLRHAAVMHREDSTPEQKKIALENIKSITQGKGQPKVNKPKAAAAPAAATGQVKLKYSPVYQHYGISQEHWNQADPAAHQELFNHHNNVMSGKVPELAHIKSAVEQSKAKMMKSVDNLHDLFSQLKKYL